MDVVSLARLQFAVTITYHYFFVPLTLGLAPLLAVMETLYVRTGDETYKRMTKFWGKLFLINFAMGVVTGIVMEFQFGMNWSQYSRFVGDIFGAPLAIEALVAFHLEATFLGVWLFGWERLSKKMHCAAIWLVAFAVNLSALWIVLANSFMQHPVGFAIRNGRAEMTDFAALVLNPYLRVTFPHVLLGGVVTGAFFVLAVSAWHLLRGNHSDFFQRSAHLAAIYGVIGALGLAFSGHAQTQRTVKVQPMKLAAAEALWETENPASFSLFTVGNESQRRDAFAIRIPRLLSLLAYNRLAGAVKGIRDLQAEYEQEYGPGNYVPPVCVTYWSFRVMVGAGLLMIALAGLTLHLSSRGTLPESKWCLRWIPLALVLPYVANTAGWMMAEVGRQPWIVFGVMKTNDAVSPTVSAGMVLTTLILFTAVYGALLVVDVKLLWKYARNGPEAAGAAASDLEY